MTDIGRVELEPTYVRWNLHSFCSASTNSAITQAFFAVPSPCWPSSSSSSFSSIGADPSSIPFFASRLPQYTRSFSCALRSCALLTPKTKDIASIKFDFPAPLGPITEVKFINGPIVWCPLFWNWLGKFYATWKSLNPPVGLEVAYFYADKRHSSPDNVHFQLRRTQFQFELRLYIIISRREIPIQYFVTLFTTNRLLRETKDRRKATPMVAEAHRGSSKMIFLEVMHTIKAIK